MSLSRLAILTFLRLRKDLEACTPPDFLWLCFLNTSRPLSCEGSDRTLLCRPVKGAYLYLLATKPAISFGRLDVLGAWPWWIDSEGLVAHLCSR